MHNDLVKDALGQVVSTPGTLEAITQAGQDPLELLARHVTDDWGEVPLRILLMNLHLDNGSDLLEDGGEFGRVSVRTRSTPSYV